MNTEETTTADSQAGNAGETPISPASAAQAADKKKRSRKKTETPAVEHAAADPSVGTLVPAGVDATERRTGPAAKLIRTSAEAGRYRCTRTIRGRHRSYVEGEIYFLANNFAPNCFERIGP